MVCSFSGKAGKALFDRVLKTEPDFSEAGTHSHPEAGDKVIANAPEIMGRYLAIKRALKNENKDTNISKELKGMNLHLIQLLDLLVKIELRVYAPEPRFADHMKVCVDGKIIIPRHQLYKHAV